MNTNKSNWRSVAARYHNTIPRTLPAGAHMGNPAIMPQVSIERWNQLKDELDATPFYLILCHAALCQSYAICRTPTKPETNSGIPTFTIPPHTYIMNFTSGGEYCLFGTHSAAEVKYNEHNFRSLLLLNDRGNVRRGNGVYPFVSSVMRAAPHSEYPNISCTFHEDDPADNNNGVFPISKADEPTNEHSIIKQDERGPYPGDPEAWYLEDIIAETYKRTGINKGIFVFAGCTSSFIQAKSRANLIGIVDEAASAAQRKIYNAEVEYATLVSAIDKDRIMQFNKNLLPTNHGWPVPIRQVDPTNAAGMAYHLNTNPKILFPDLQAGDPDNFKKVENILNH